MKNKIRILLITLLLLGCFLSINLITASASNVLYYNWTNDNGNVITDDSGTGNNGWNIGTSQRQLYSGATIRDFTASSTYITVATSSSLNTTSSITIQALVQLNGTKNQNLVVRGFGANNYLFGSDPNGKIYFANTYNSTAHAFYTSSLLLNNDQSLFLAVTYDTSNVKMYINGVLVSSQSTGGIPLGMSGGNLTINNQYGNSITGKLYYLKIDNTVLSQSDIQQDMSDNLWRINPAASINNNAITGSETLNYKLNLSYAYPSNSTVDFSFIDGTAKEHTDYNINNSYNSSIIFVTGDSIAQGGTGTPHNNLWGIAGWLAGTMPNNHFTDVGIGSRTTTDCINNYTVEIYPYNPDYAFIEVGTNDLNMAHTSAQIIANLTTYCEMMKANGTTPILNTLLPRGASYNTTISEVNTWIRGSSYNYFDAWAVFVNPATGNSILPEYTSDTIHPNNDGYQAWANAISSSQFPGKRYSVAVPVNQAYVEIPINTVNNWTETTTKTFQVQLSNPTKYVNSTGATVSTISNTTIGSPSLATITINELTATANFTASSFSGTNPLTVSFTDLSTGTVDNYAWNFGDGSANVTTKNASHTFTNPGNYTVVLTVSNDGGSSTNSTVISVVNAPVVPSDSPFNISTNLVIFGTLGVLVFVILLSILGVYAYVEINNIAYNSQRRGYHNTASDVGNVIAVVIVGVVMLIVGFGLAGLFYVMFFGG